MPRKRTINELLENAQGVPNEDEIEVYGGEEGEAEDMDMDMGYEDEADMEADSDDFEAGPGDDGDLDELISQLKGIVDELENMEDNLGADDDTIDSDEMSFDAKEDEDEEMSLDFNDEEEEVEEVEEAKCGSTDEDVEDAEELEEAAKAVAASAAGDGAAEGGKATGPESKQGGSAGKADSAKVEADDEKAIEDTIKAITSSTPSKDTSAASGKGKKVNVKQTNPAIASTGEGIIKVENVEVDFSKEIAAIISMDSTLSESAQKKTAKLFENAVNKKVGKINNRLSAYYTELLESRVTEFQEKMVEKVDQYLDYVVENYMEDNALAIEEGLKVRVSSSFLEGLGKLFEEHYVSVPESKVDLVEKLETEIESAEAKNNELYEHAIKLRRENVQLRKDRAFRKLSEGMSAVEVSKFKTLTENVEYKNQKQFVKAIEAVKATHFVNENVVAPKPQEFETLAEDTKPNPMDKYVNAIRKLK